MKQCLAALAILLALATQMTFAGDFQHAESGLQFTLPEGWTCVEKENQLFIANEDKSLSCVGGVVPKEAAQAIFADIKKFLNTLDGFADAEVTDGPKKEKVNGLEQAWYEGTATFADAKGKRKKMEWDMTFISGGKAVLFLVGTGELDDNEDEYEEFFESIRKIGTRLE